MPIFEYKCNSCGKDIKDLHEGKISISVVGSGSKYEIMSVTNPSLCDYCYEDIKRNGSLQVNIT